MSTDPSDDEEPSDGHLQPTSAGLVTAWAVTGLVGGWLLHPVAEGSPARHPW